MKETPATTTAQCRYATLSPHNSPQCLVQTWGLRDVFARINPCDGIKNFLNLTLTPKGTILHKLDKVLRTAWTGEKSSFSPYQLLTEVSKRHPKFKPNIQQDSQEFLSLLLNDLSDEIRYARKQYRANLEKKPEETKQEETPEPTGSANPYFPGEYMKEFKEPTFIETMFEGQTRSLVTCLTCQHESVMYEPFGAILLPLANSILEAKKLYFSRVKPVVVSKPKDKRKGKKKQYNPGVEILGAPPTPSETELPPPPNPLLNDEFGTHLVANDHRSHGFQSRDVPKFQTLDYCLWDFSSTFLTPTTHSQQTLPLFVLTFAKSVTLPMW